MISFASAIFLTNKGKKQAEKENTIIAELELALFKRNSQ